MSNTTTNNANLVLEIKLKQRKVTPWEMYGDSGVNVEYFYNVTANGCNFTIASKKEWDNDTDVEGIVKKHICEKICSDKGNLIRAFDVLNLTDEDYMMPLCEDDFLMGESQDIRKLANNEETFLDGREFNSLMRGFLMEHFCEDFIEVLANRTFVANAFSLQMVSEDCNLDIKHIDVDEFNEIKNTAVSFVGHEDTAEALGVEFHRGFLSLKEGDTLYVAQLTNGRLPDGTTNLPENFIFKYVKVSIN